MIRITDITEKYIPIKVTPKAIKICFDYEPFYSNDINGNKVETNIGTWTKHTFTTKKSFSQIKEFILSEINKRIDKKILTGFVWKEMPIWLSTENQFNYKAAFDLAMQTNGNNLPTTFKFGTTENPVYYEFKTIEDLMDFYVSATTYINNCLLEGWARKDSIDWKAYENALK